MSLSDKALCDLYLAESWLSKQFKDGRPIKSPLFALKNSVQDAAGYYVWPLNYCNGDLEQAQKFVDLLNEHLQQLEMQKLIGAL